MTVIYINYILKNFDVVQQHYLFFLIQMIYNSHKQVFSSLHSIFIRSCTDMLTNERNIELKSPTDELGRHVLMTVIYITVNGFPTVKFWRI